MKKTFRSLVAFVLVLMMLLGLTGVFVVSAENEAQATITVNGESFKAAVGDVVVYTARLQYKGGVETVSASVSYNPEVLELIEEPEDVCLPNLLFSPLFVNCPAEGKVNFLDTSYNRLFDFSENQVLATFRFTVIGEGNNDFSIFFNQFYAPYEILIQDGVIMDDSVTVSQSAGLVTEDRYLNFSYKGVTYTVKEGETVTVDIYAEAPEAIKEIRASAYFDHKLFKLSDNTFEERYPNLRHGSEDNVGRSHSFRGYSQNTDFHSDGPALLATLRYLVTGESTTKIEIYCDMNSTTGNSYQSEENSVKIIVEPSVEGKKLSGKVTSGDADEDGIIKVKDATAIQKFAAKVIVLSEYSQYSADVNADSKVNVKDATAVQKYLAKINTGYPIGEYLPLK